MALAMYKTKLKYGFIDINADDNRRITNWREKPEISGLINIGCYVFEPEFLKLIPESSSYGMDDAVRESINQNKNVSAFIVEENGFIDIGDKKSYLEAHKTYVKKLGKI
jgi:mannose-1-phosphate guanylyltransferase